MDFIRAIETALGKKAIIDFQPMQAGDVTRTWADIGKLQQQAGYTPSFSIVKGITNFISWYKQYYRI
jgi:UDP-glucuronate 4-epimerase